MYSWRIVGLSFLIGFTVMSAGVIIGRYIERAQAARDVYRGPCIVELHQLQTGETFSCDPFHPKTGYIGDNNVIVCGCPDRDLDSQVDL